MTPRQSVEAECERRGKKAVVAGCIELLMGRPTDDGLVAALGGPPASDGAESVPQPYWLRVWAARGLLWAWDDAALPALTRALTDENWRVRETAAKVAPTASGYPRCCSRSPPRARRAPSAATIALVSGTACAVGPCAAPRAAGSSYCTNHGPKEPTDRRPGVSSANASMVCPHCTSTGTVKTKAVKAKRGVSGAKATAAVFTAGISLLGTGLSRKEKLTEAHCTKCGMTWHIG